MKIRINIIIIATLITAMLLSGCQNNNSYNDGETAQTSEMNTITFGLIGLQNASEESDSTSYKIHQKILEDFDINIEVITLNKDTWKDELDQMIAQNSLPDVFFHDITDDTMQYRQLIDLGIIRDIPKSMWTKRENLAKVISWYEDIYSVDGKMYFVPRTYQTFDQTHGASYAILYRKDWAYLVNSLPSDPPHFSDVVNMVKAFVGGDPDGNDVKDTWGITGGNGYEFINYAFLSSFGVRDWMYEDGKWIPGILSSQAKESVAWISQLYKEGAIDQDFTQQSQQAALNKFITGKAGACLVNIYPEQIKSLEEKWSVYNTDSISQTVDIIPLYYAPDGFKRNEVETFSTGTMFSAGLSDSDMEKVLDLINWMYSEEGRLYFEYGIEGVDYSLSATGDILPISTDDENPEFFGEKNVEYKPLENLASWNLDFPEFYLNRMSVFQSYAKDILENDIWAYSYQSEIFTNGMLTPEICVLNIETVARDMLYDVIMTSSDFETSWNDFVDYCYATFNVEKASQEVAQRALELGISAGD